MATGSDWTGIVPGLGVGTAQQEPVLNKGTNTTEEHVLFSSGVMVSLVDQGSCVNCRYGCCSVVLVLVRI